MGTKNVQLSMGSRKMRGKRFLPPAAFGPAKAYGSSRSIVRRIATNLPLAPCPRVHFQLHPYTVEACVNRSGGPNGLVASLADVAWIDREENDYAERPRSEAQAGLFFRTQQRQPLRRQRSLPSLHQAEPEPQSQTVVNDVAIQKISALEVELAKLQAQIAQIVQAQNTQAAAPVSAAPPGPPAPLMPPPPPPPCPPPPGLQRSYSAMDLIKERRGKKSNQQMVLDQKQAEVPNMLDVLKDIGKVKLRSVKSRPEEGHAKPKPAEPLDAAALIAEALKRKFAHRYRNDDIENDFNFPAPEVKPRPTPTPPTFGQHMLKSTGKRELL